MVKLSGDIVGAMKYAGGSTSYKILKQPQNMDFNMALSPKSRHKTTIKV